MENRKKKPVYSVRFGSCENPDRHKYFMSTDFDWIYSFALFYNVVETIQVKL